MGYLVGNQLGFAIETNIGTYRRKPKLYIPDSCYNYRNSAGCSTIIGYNGISAFDCLYIYDIIYSSIHLFIT